MASPVDADKVDLRKAHDVEDLEGAAECAPADCKRLGEFFAGQAKPFIIRDIMKRNDTARNRAGLGAVIFVKAPGRLEKDLIRRVEIRPFSDPVVCEAV